MRQLPIPATISKYWGFRGGLDQVTSPLTINPGFLRDSSNVEVGTSGAYVTATGYERYDGHASPSDAVYYVLACTIVGTPVVGNSIAGATSGATAVIIATTASSLIITKLVGVFSASESVTGSGATVTTTAAAARGAASTPALNATYRNLAADAYRSDIAAVPGSGSILGVWQYNDVLYALRNNAGSTAAAMYKSTASGWSLVNLGRELAFTAGQSALVVGATITGAISGATAVIGQIVVTSGSLAGGTGAGYIYFASQTGTFQAENINVGGVAKGTIAGNSSAITLAKDGRYEFVNANFGGAAGSTKMYGCDGVNKAFEFDGTTFARITTGMPTGDTPLHIAAHKNHLFLSFQGSAQHSGTGTPLSWTVVTGAAEIAVGDTITGFQPVVGGTSGGALVIFSRASTNILYGNGSSDWVLVPFNREAGAMPYTAQWIGQGVWMDARGVTTLSATQNFGNFSDSDISVRVRPYVTTLRSSVIASCIVRQKSQYRVFFSGGDALYVTFINGKLAGCMPQTLTNAATCACSQETSTGVERMFFGSTNGMVYELDKGTSHDGENLSWSMQLHPNHFGSPMQLKTFRDATIEISGQAYAEFNVGYTLAYGATELPAAVDVAITSNLSASQWDIFTWDEFFWDGSALSPAFVDLDGTAQNIALAFSGSSDAFDPVTFNGANVSFTPRRVMRRALT